jgi:hypothetical protein
MKNIIIIQKLLKIKIIFMRLKIQNFQLYISIIFWDFFAITIGRSFSISLLNFWSSIVKTSIQ